MSEVQFHNDDHSFSWEKSQSIADWLQLVCEKEKKKLTSLSYVFCSDRRLLEINRQHLNHDYYTDIITFDLSEDSSIEGEIYISLDRVVENAASFQVAPELELCRVHVHGLLHLIGYDDHSKSDKQIMRDKEDTYLSLLPEVPRGTF